MITKKRNSWFKSSLFSSIGLILFGLILLRLDIGEIVVNLSTIRIAFLPLIIAVDYLTLAIKTLRWMTFFKSQGMQLSFRQAFKIYLYATFLGIATVGQAIDLSKAYFLQKLSIANSQAEKNTFSLGQAGMSVFLERFLELGLYLGAGTIGIILWKGYSSPDSLELSLGVFILLYLVGAYIFLYHARRLSKVSGKISNGKGRVSGWFFRNLRDFLEEIDNFPKKKMIKPLLLTFVSYLAMSYNIQLIAGMTNIEITYTQALLIYPLLFLANILPITVGGFGTRDLVLLYWFSFSGVPAERVIAFSIMYFSVTLLALAVTVPFIHFSQNDAQGIKG